jgi:uncharacterized protein with GYD domain
MRVVFLASYTSNSFKGLMAGSDRRAAVETLLASVGGKLESLTFTRGEYDVVVVVDAKDHETTAGVALALHASEAFTKMSILEELDMSKVIPIAQKAAQAFKPAG